MRRLDLGHRHQCAEHSAARTRVAFDDATMVADDLGDEREPEARARRLGGDERVEQMRHQIRRDALAIVLDGNLERQADARLTAGNGEAYAWPERSRQRDLTVGTLLADR